MQKSKRDSYSWTEGVSDYIRKSERVLKGNQDKHNYLDNDQVLTLLKNMFKAIIHISLPKKV